ncbi:MAG: DUF4298 domain-containing protein, partial [Atopobiaceae bacterium]|nr:DUF4298 domain-containing protein [Atopobiaceae bacterium]
EADLVEVEHSNRLMEAAQEARSKTLPAALSLAGYLDSGAWAEDFARDEAGELPADLRRGVLSEDAAYDALTGFDEDDATD